MNTKYDELIRKLREILQIDKPDLDFGIYKVLRTKSDMIKDFLDTKLREHVRSALQSGGGEDVESAVYSHMLAFFSRYYDNGDFISQRRYKEGVYAIPYSGEEVKLHWANADQYYTKSGESFANYDFTLDNGAKVHFKLVSAATAKDNKKDAEGVRLFELWDPADAPVAEDGDDGDDADGAPAYPADFIEERDGELFFYFRYREFPKKTKQADKSKAASEAVSKRLKELGLSEEKYPLFAQPEKDKARTLFEAKLADYTAKNTSDYFIHKDLGKFLRRELDFYVKNEMMHLDDIQDAATFDAAAANLRLIQAFRAVSLELIDFMAQLEDFQKGLWLKKKFVVQCDYCVTLDRIPEEKTALLGEIFANERQKKEWASLGLPADSRERDSRMVDTKFFDAAFKAKLLRIFGNLDKELDGVIVKSENFQALNLMQEKYRGQVKCIYIDPPYNAKTSEILYKNTFKHSSWMSLMANRLLASVRMFGKDTVQVTAIDEVEQERLGQLLLHVFPGHEKICVSVMHNHRGQQGKNISYVHEFAFFTYLSDSVKSLADMKRAEIDSRTLRDSGLESDRTDAATCFYPFFVKDGKIIGFGEIPDDEYHPSANNVLREDGVMEIWPIDDDGNEKKWRYSNKTVASIMNKLVVEKRRKAYQIIFNKDTGTMRSLWEDAKYDASEHGTKRLQALFGVKYWKENAETLYPKSLFTVKDAIQVAANGCENGYVLDYFAGSGTTAHAVIDLNREDGGKRKYILVEMGDHFDTVLKPRIEKVVYSPKWKDGKPETASEGISHAFKYLTLESYEDTLTNIRLETPKGAQPELLLRDEYLLRYLFTAESRASRLSSEAFRNPFDYRLEIAKDSSGATEPTHIDLVETFNWLIGLRVEGIDASPDKGHVFVEGLLPDGKKALVVWRDCDRIDNEALAKLLEDKHISAANSEFAFIYVNGDHSLANRTVESGGAESGPKIQQIETEFIGRMFPEDC